MLQTFTCSTIILYLDIKLFFFLFEASVSFYFVTNPAIIVPSFGIVQSKFVSIVAAPSEEIYRVRLK